MKKKCLKRRSAAMLAAVVAVSLPPLQPQNVRIQRKN
jgi:hypothetical protein